MWYSSSSAGQFARIRIDVYIAQFGVHEYGRILRKGKQAGAAGDDERYGERAGQE